MLWSSQPHPHTINITCKVQVILQNTEPTISGNQRRSQKHARFSFAHCTHPKRSNSSLEESAALGSFDSVYVRWIAMKVHCKFIKSATAVEQFPVPGPPEIAFLGRSNVGKSSLINSLLGARAAHVSSTPGRTRTINFFAIHASAKQPRPEMIFADLPGYGYAKISKQISAEWPKFIEPYLADRSSLRLCISLIDVNVPPQASDHQLIEWLRDRGRDFLVVATKADRLSANKLRNALALLKREHGISEILPYSSKTGAGAAELWKAIRQAASSGTTKK